MGCKKFIGRWPLMIVILFLLSFSPAFAAPGLYNESKLGAFEFTLEFVVKNTGRTEARSIHGEIPVMAWNGLPSYQKINSVIANPPVVWNKDGYKVSFKLDSLAPQDSYQMSIKYKLEISEHFQDPDNEPAPTGYGSGWMAEYLKTEDGIEAGNPQIVAVINQLGVKTGTPKEKARKIFSFVSESLDYRIDFSRDADALTALHAGWGRCEDYAMLFAALCRTAGVPTRLVYGFRVEPEEVRGYQPQLIDAGHVWAEVYLPNAGWVSVDPTYTALSSGKKITDYRFFAGFYPDDIHIFMHYGQPNPKVYYRSTPDTALEVEYKFYISRIG